MMRDLRHIGSSKSRSKGKPNRTLVKKEPLDLRKYLLPMLRFGGMAIGLLVVCGLLAVVLHRLTSSIPFPVQQIVVNDTKRVSKEELVALAGLSPGDDMLKLRLKSIGSQIASNPWIDDIKIQRIFPGTVSINITEREPLAVVNLGLLYYLDAKANLFKPLNFGDRLDYPVISGFTEEDLSIDPAGTEEALKNACLLLALMQNLTVIKLEDVSEINYNKKYGLTIYTTKNTASVSLGSENLPEKLERFAQIYEHLKTQQPGLRHIDLDYKDRIVVTKG